MRERERERRGRRKSRCAQGGVGRRRRTGGVTPCVFPPCPRAAMHTAAPLAGGRSDCSHSSVMHAPASGADAPPGRRPAQAERQRVQTHTQPAHPFPPACVPTSLSLLPRGSRGAGRPPHPGRPGGPPIAQGGHPWRTPSGARRHSLPNSLSCVRAPLKVPADRSALGFSPVAAPLRTPRSWAPLGSFGEGVLERASLHAQHAPGPLLLKKNEGSSRARGRKTKKGAVCRGEGRGERGGTEGSESPLLSHTSLSTSTAGHPLCFLPPSPRTHRAPFLPAVAWPI